SCTSTPGWPCWSAWKDAPDLAFLSVRQSLVCATLQLHSTPLVLSELLQGYHKPPKCFYPFSLASVPSRERLKIVFGPLLRISRSLQATIPFFQVRRNAQ